jgi:alpha-galactosidase
VRTLQHLPPAVALAFVGFLSVSADAPDVVVQVADAYVAQDESGRAWTIGNEGIVFRVGLNAEGALITLDLERPGAESTWTLGSGSGLSFQQQGRRLSPGHAGFPFRSAHAEEHLGGVRLTLVFDEQASGLRLTRSYACYPGAPVIEVWSTFEAIASASGIPISDIGMWQLGVPVREVHWVTGLRGGEGATGAFSRRQEVLSADEPLEIGSSDRSSEFAVPVWSFSGPGSRFFGGVLWSGAWALTATSGVRNLVTVRLSAGPTSTVVRMGDPFETPHGFFGLAGDRDVEVTSALQRYVTTGLRGGRRLTPLVTYNTWFAYGTQIDDPSVRAEMRSAASLGVELFVLDAGWYAGAKSASDFSTGLGSWTVDNRRFPAGLGPLGDYARSLGMKFGVWVEPERVDTTTVNRTGLARERMLATTGGRYNAGVRNEHAGAAQICLADSEARQWVLGQLVRFIDEARPDYLKWDNNYWINCDRTSHGHGTQDGNFAHVRGLYALLAALRERYPDLLIENCSGGGHRLDFGMLRYSDVGWMDDVSGPSARVRHHLEGLGPLFPAGYLLSFVVDDAAEPIHQAEDMPLYFRSRMAGVLGMSLRGDEFGEADLADMKREIALYKRLRDAAAAPVMALLTGQTGETANGSWDAMQLLAMDSGGGFLLAFRGPGADRRTVLRPLNLRPGVLYEVSPPRGRPFGRADGTSLMEDGVEVGAWPFSDGHVVVLTPVER